MGTPRSIPMPDFTTPTAERSTFTPTLIVDSDSVGGWRFPTNVPEGTFVKVDVDDIIAGYMLEHVPAFQRDPEPARVNQWTKVMIAKRWRRLSQAPLGFTPDFKLVNGRHRLLAVVQAYKLNPNQEPLPFWLDMNSSEEDFDVIDTGKERTTTDVLKAMGVRQSVAVGAGIRLLAGYDLMPRRENRYGDWKTQQIPNIEIREHYVPLRGLIDHDVDKVVAAAKATSYNRGALVACYYIARRDDPEGATSGFVDEFIQRMYDGSGRGKGDPVTTLRDWANRKGYKGNVARDGEKKLPIPALMMKAFINTYNRLRAGEEMFSVAWSGRSMPLLKGPKQAQLNAE